MSVVELLRNQDRASDGHVSPLIVRQALFDHYDRNMRDTARYKPGSMEHERTLALAMAYWRDLCNYDQLSFDLTPGQAQILRIKAEYFETHDESDALYQLQRMPLTMFSAGGMLKNWGQEPIQRAHQIEASAGKPMRWAPDKETVLRARRELAAGIRARLEPRQAQAAE